MKENKRAQWMDQCITRKSSSQGEEAYKEPPKARAVFFDFI